MTFCAWFKSKKVEYREKIVATSFGSLSLVGKENQGLCEARNGTDWNSMVTNQVMWI